MDDEVIPSESTMDEAPVIANEDRAAVAEYLMSDRYRQYKTWSVESSSREMMPFIKSRWCPPGASSFVAGPLGLAFITLVFAILLPIGIEAMQEFTPRRPVYTTMMMIVQTLALPPLIAFAFATVTPMFWYGSVVVRFAMALASTLPACIGFGVVLTLFEAGNPDDFWIGFCLVMFTSLLTTAATAVTIQMWSRWTMTHYRVDDESLPRAGTRSMIELTAIAAVGCSVFVSIDLGEYIEGILFFGGLGFISAITITSALIAYFRAGKNRRTAMVIGFLFAFAAAYLLNGFFAATEYGWDVLSMEALLIGSVSLYGAALNIAVMWLCLRWLKACGWRCINRKTEPTARLQTTGPSSRML